MTLHSVKGGMRRRNGENERQEKTMYKDKGKGLCSLTLSSYIHCTLLAFRVWFIISQDSYR